MSATLSSAGRLVLDVAVWSSLTVGAYAVGLGVKRAAKGAALASPVLIAIGLVIALLTATGTPYIRYAQATLPISFLLGPATVALGLPLAENLAHVRRSLLAIAVALPAGSVAAMVSGVVLVKVFGGDRILALSMLPKAATTPIVIGVAQQVGGQPGLSAALAITGGIIAAMTVQGVLALVRVSDLRAVGLAAGVAGSGVGAARVAPLHGTAAAFAALGVGLNGIATAILAPVLARWI